MTILLPLLLLAAAPADTHPFGVRDMQAMERISSPVVSPDGKQVVFVIATTDLDANKRTTSLWKVSTSGQGLMRLTHATSGKDSEPVFSPDGKWLYFVSTRSGSSQVWKLAMDGGEAQQVTDEPLDVANLAVSPDGTKLAYSMDVFPDCDPACTKKRQDDQESAKKGDAKIFDQMFIRHWDSWSDGTRTHLFVRPVAGGSAVDLVKSFQADVPSKPFGGPEEYAFTPDSKSVVFSMRDQGAKEPTSTNFDLYLVGTDGGTPKNLTAANLAWDTNPVFSPDGKTLAYFAMSRPGFESDRQRIVLRSWPDGAPKTLTEAWTDSPGSLVWSKDGKTLYATADHLQSDAIFAVDVATGKATPIVAQGTNHSPSPAADRLVFTHEDMRHPAEVFSSKKDGSDLKPLTHVDDARMAATRTGEFESFSFAGAGGDTVHGWIVKPADFEPSKHYPVALLIHGGPQGSWDNDFHYRWNPEAFAGAGYAVVTIDPHGSSGYGQAFEDEVSGDWGGKPLEDLQKGLAAAIAKSPWMDGDRAAALGASYGGYMIYWIAGNWPDRFKCLVAHDGVFDTRASYFDTEELWFPEWEFKGVPWEKPELYEKWNPSLFVSKWKSPMLIIHSANDFRLTDFHGRSAFTALQRRGIPSRFVYFPDESHWVTKPQNSIEWYDTVIAWLDRWTKNPSSAKAP